MASKHTLGWIGMGRMGYPMAERLLKAGHDVSASGTARAPRPSRWRSSAGAVVDKPADLAGCDVVFSMVSTGKDLEEVCFGKDGVAARRQRQAAESVRRLLVDLAGGIRRDPREAASSSARISSPRR